MFSYSGVSVKSVSLYYRRKRNARAEQSQHIPRIAFNAFSFFFPKTLMSAKKLLPGVVLGCVVTTWATSAALVQRVIAFTGNPEDRHAKVRKATLDAQLLPTMFRNQFVIKSRLYSYDIEQPVVIHRTAIAKLKLQSDF